MAENLKLSEKLNYSTTNILTFFVIISIMINKTNSIILPFEDEPVCFYHEITEDNLIFNGYVQIVNFTGLCDFIVQSETNKKFLIKHLVEKEQHFTYEFESDKDLIKICFLKTNNNHENALIHFTMQDPSHPEKPAQKEKLEDYNSYFEKATKEVVKLSFEYVNEKFKRDTHVKMFGEISSKIISLTLVKIALILALIFIKVTMIINLFKGDTNKIVNRIVLNDNYNVDQNNYGNKSNNNWGNNQNFNSVNSNDKEDFVL
jgi:hypothetical protein